MSVKLLNQSLISHQPLLSTNVVFDYLEETHYQSLMPSFYQIGDNLVVASFEYMKTLPAFYAVGQALKRKELNFGDTVIESTSGNMGIGLSKAWSNLINPETGQKDNKTCLVGSPNGVNDYIVQELRTLNAETHIVTKADNGNFQLNRLRYLAQLRENLLECGNKIYWPQQYDNQDLQKSYHPLIDYASETIQTHFSKDIDVFVCSVGTGAAFSGGATRIKEINPDAKAACVDFQGSNILGKESLPDGVMIGVGGFMKCNNTNYNVIDDCHYVDQNQAVFQQLDMLNKGLSMGYSSGGTFQVAKWYADTNPDKVVFMIAPDRVDRYRTRLLTKDMMAREKIIPSRISKPDVILHPNDVLDTYKDEAGVLTRPALGYGWQMIESPARDLRDHWIKAQKQDALLRQATFAEGRHLSVIPHTVYKSNGEKLVFD